MHLSQIKKYDYDDESRELLNKKIFIDLAVKMQDEILKLDKEINYSHEYSYKDLSGYYYTVWTLLGKIGNGKKRQKKTKINLK